MIAHGSLRLGQMVTLKTFLAQGPENLFLPTKLVPLPHLQDPLSSKLFQEGVHGMSEAQK